MRLHYYSLASPTQDRDRPDPGVGCARERVHERVNERTRREKFVREPDHSRARNPTLVDVHTDQPAGRLALTLHASPGHPERVRRPNPIDLAALALVPWLAACPSDAASDDEAESSETTPVFEPPPPECGNGYLEPGEDCDDANTLDGDGCDSLCRLPCGLAFESRLSVSVPDVIAVVVDMAIAPNGDIVIAATHDAQVSSITDDLWLGRWTSAGELLWSDFFDFGGDELTSAVVVDAQGRMYLSGTVGADDDGTDAWLRGFDPEGNELWTQTYSGSVAGSKDGANGLALAPEGGLVISGFQRVADKDGDAWIAKLDSADGSIVWESFWSGPVSANGYSLDVGGKLTIDDEGRIWTMPVEYVDFETYDAHLIELANDGSGVLVDIAPQAGGTDHEHVGAGLVADAGKVYFGIARLGPGATFWVHALDSATQELAWVREMPSFVDEGDTWTLRDLSLSLGEPSDGLLFVAGDLVRDEKEDTWAEAFVHRLDAAGQTTCATRYSPPGEMAVAPDLFVGAVASDAAGNSIAAGRLTEADASRLIWIGSFRGP